MEHDLLYTEHNLLYTEHNLLYMEHNLCETWHFAKIMNENVHTSSRNDNPFAMFFQEYNKIW